MTDNSDCCHLKPLSFKLTQQQVTGALSFPSLPTLSTLTFSWDPLDPPLPTTLLLPTPVCLKVLYLRPHLL